MFIQVVNETQEHIDTQIEQYLIDFFGSEEAARKHIHMYVLEYGQPQIKKPSDTMDGRFVYTLEQAVRLRLKTPEELASEVQHDELEGWEPTKWWQALDESDNILAETSSPSDFKTLGLYGKPGVTIVRLYKKTHIDEFMAVKENPFQHKAKE